MTMGQCGATNSSHNPKVLGKDEQRMTKAYQVHLGKPESRIKMKPPASAEQEFIFTLERGEKR